MYIRRVKGTERTYIRRVKGTESMYVKRRGYMCKTSDREGCWFDQKGMPG